MFQRGDLSPARRMRRVRQTRNNVTRSSLIRSGGAAYRALASPPMDITVLSFFNRALANSFLDVFFLLLTWIGNPTLHIVVLPALLLFKRTRRIGGALLATIGMTLAITLLFQFAVSRVRPTDVRLIWPQSEFPSYPSGHTSCAFATAMLIGLRMRSRRVWIGAITCAALVALSRLYLGQHFPSDLAGGVLLGSGLGIAAYGLLLAPADGAGRLRIRWLFWAQLGIALLATHMAYLDLLPWLLLRWPYADKVLHAVLMGGMTFWLNLIWPGRAWRVGRMAIPLAIAVPLVIIVAEEFAQKLSPVRTFDLLDLAGDMIGMLLAWAASQGVLHAQSSRLP